MTFRNILWLLLLGMMIGLPARRVAAQAPTIGTELPQPGGAAGTPGSANSLFGPVPGSGGGSFASPVVGGGQILGGRPGAATPRVPTSISTPGGTSSLAPPSVPALPRVPPLTQVPLYGTLDLPSGVDEGPPEGLTFDQAIGLLIQENLELKARAFEIPSAQADILTAGLRGNPILYGDSQLIPYGSYSKSRQGGPTQYDLNISQPIDYVRKWKSRVAVALKTKDAIELQYQDAVRIQIGNLAGAYVNVLAARETLRYAEAGLAGLDRILNATITLKKLGNRTSSDVAMLQAQKAAAEVGVDDAREGLRKAKLALGGYFNMPPSQAEAIELRDTLRDQAPPPPPEDQLYEMALTCRPDVRSFQVGIEVAIAALKLQKANRFADAYLLYQPFTYQNLNYLTPHSSATSWALGVTVPLPVFNRNQGNIARAGINIEQSRVQFESAKRVAIEQVRDAEREYATTRTFLERFEQFVLPPAKQMMADQERLYKMGETADIIPYLNAQQNYNNLLSQYRNTAVRHRRSMFGLNTAVGSRVLP